MLQLTSFIRFASTVLWNGQAHASTATSGGMMCGAMGAAAADDPMADKPAQKPQASGMCACCRNMAMMRGGSTQHHNMPGMDMPKQ